MEKLIELLNEYGKDNWKYDEYYGFYVDDKTGEEELRIATKRYGFIQWLVDNDKIDRHKFYERNIIKGFMTITKEEKADSVIMNLSIQNNPIEFLVSILK